MGYISQLSKQVSNEPTDQKKNWLIRFGQNAQDFAVGIAKGAASTVKGALDVGRKVGELGTGVKTDNYIENVVPKEVYTPQNTAEKAGFVTEQIAEFLAPTKFIKEAELAINAASKASKLTKTGQAVTRVVGKALADATTTGTIRAAQTGGDVGETTKAALGAGLFRGVTAIVGEAARAFRLPERLYNTVFKSTYDDAMNELKTTSLNSLKQTDPDLYNQAVKNGLIKTAKTGEVVIDQRLAREALDRGLKGSLQNMANAVVKGQVKSELLARQTAKAFKGRVAVSEPQYYRVLTQVATDYKNVGFGELAEEASKYAKLIKSSKGKLDPLDALNLRRFFDKMRFASSYVKEPTLLSQSQANFKFLSDALRTRVNRVPGMKDVMKDYAFYIDALEALGKEARRRGNNQVVSLIDSLFFSTGLASGNPVLGVGAGVARKLINMPTGATNIASAVENAKRGLAGQALRGSAVQATATQQPTETP